MLEIVSPASTTDLVLPEIVTLGWDGEAPDPALVDAAISAASTLAARWCGRNFVIQGYRERLKPSFRRKLVLKESPVQAVTSVLQYDAPITQYRIDSNLGMLIKEDGAWGGTIASVGPLRGGYSGSDIDESIVVEYTAGWTPKTIDPVGADLPGDLEMAVAELALDIIKKQLGMPTGDVESATVGPFKTKNGAVDSMVGPKSGYWAEAIGDPSFLWIPLRTRRVLMMYRRIDA